MGHSFVVGLKDHFRNNGLLALDQTELARQVAKRLQVNDFIQEVHLVGGRGARLEDVTEKNMGLVALEPDIVLLEMGTNDLVGFRDPASLARSLREKAQEIQKKCKAVVGILSIIPREGGLGGLSVEEFEFRRASVNRAVAILVRGERAIFACKHKGFTEVQCGGEKFPLEVSDWSEDGIHPNSREGRIRYKKSLRTALCRGWKKLVDFQ